MRTYDFSPLFRSTIGFDRLAHMLDTATREEAAPGYPPYNIEKHGEDRYRITMAVAGFSADELDVEVRENTLTISGRQDDGEEGVRYLHRGIAGRSFERRFQLADHVKVVGADLENGLLHVDLAREIPEEMRPRTIEISEGKGGARLIQGEKAA